MNDERRTSARKKSFLKGRVYFNNRLSSLDCVIRDFSDEGARLEFGATPNLPDVVDLYIPTRDQMLRAQLRWRRDNEVGVSFGSEIAADRPALASADLGKRVEALEHELAKLQRQFQEFRAELRRQRGED